MSSTNDAWRTNLIWWLAASLAMGAAFWLGIGPQVGAMVGGGMLVLTAALHVGRRRSDTLSVISGTGDERIRDLYTRATATAGAVLALVIFGWWLATLVVDGPDRISTASVLSVLWTVFAVTAIIAAFYHARRG